MLTISKAISSAQAQTYHKLEYTSDAQSYYKQEDTVKGEWQGRLTYDPAQLSTQTRESRVFQEETREIAEGERIRFNRYDKELGIRSGDLGTVTRLGQDHSMTVQLDSGKTAEVSPEKSRNMDYGYAVEDLKGNRADRVIATGDGLTQQVFQGSAAKGEHALYTGTPAPAQEFTAAKEITSPEIPKPAAQQHDFGIGF